MKLLLLSTVCVFYKTLKQQWGYLHLLNHIDWLGDT